MIVDSSALIALIFRGRSHVAIRRSLAGADLVAAGAPTLAETGIVLEARLGKAAHGMLERIVHEFSIEQVSFGAVHWGEAVDAFRRFPAHAGYQTEPSPLLREELVDVGEGRARIAARRGLDEPRDSDFTGGVRVVHETGESEGQVARSPCEVPRW